LTENQSAREANAILETNFERANIGDELAAVVCQSDFFPVHFLKLKLQTDVFRNTQMQRPGICQNVQF
jgi:hypothetical protein